MERFRPSLEFREFALRNCCKGQCTNSSPKLASLLSRSTSCSELVATWKRIAFNEFVTSTPAELDPVLLQRLKCDIRSFGVLKALTVYYLPP